MMQDIIEVRHREKLSSTSPNPPQLIKEDFLGVLFLVFFLFFFYCTFWKFFCQRP